MAVVFGGSFLLWAAAKRLRSSREDLSDGRRLLAVAKQYEWFFWGGLGLLALTGVGNIGNLGSNLPAIDSAWGSRLLIKLIAVLILVLFSSMRTWLIAAYNGREEDTPTSGVAARLQNLYAGTILLIIVILILAVSLSHG